MRSFAALRMTLLMLSTNRNKFQKLIAFIAKPFLKVHPNILTFISLLFAVLFFIALFYHIYILALCSSIGLLFDAIDGYVARTTNKTSAFGAFLDSTLDRVADFLVISAFGFAHLVSWEIVTVLLAMSFLVSYVRSRAEIASKLQIAFGDGLIQRAERLIIIFISLLAYVVFPNLRLGSWNIVEIVFLLLILLSTYTLIQRIWSTYKRVS